MEKINVGDVVQHRDNWGRAEPKEAKIVQMELCEAVEGKHGTEVMVANYADKDRLSVVLDNGKWAYGTQIEVVGKHFPALTH